MPNKPRFQELLWRGIPRGFPSVIAERRVLSFPVVPQGDFLRGVERLDVIEQGDGCVGARKVAGAMHPLILQAVEEALSWRIIPTVFLPAHRTDHAVLLQPRLKGVAGILASPVRMMHQSRPRLSPEPGHGQRINHDVCRHPRLDRPAHDLSVEQVNDNSQIQPAFVRPDMGHVRCPYFVRRGRHEVSLQQVVRHRQVMLGVRRRLVAPLFPCPDAVLPHQAFFHPWLTCREASIPQFPGHARTSVSTLQFSMNGANQGQHLDIGQPRSARLATSPPRPVAADADRQHVAHHGQRIGLTLRVDPGIPQGFPLVIPHSASFAKYAPKEIPLGDTVAFFSIATSILSRASRLAFATISSAPVSRLSFPLR